MNKLKTCSKCKIYTLKEICPKCKTSTTSAHHKFIKIKNAPANFKKKSETPIV